MSDSLKKMMLFQILSGEQEQCERDPYDVGLLQVPDGKSTF